MVLPLAVPRGPTTATYVSMRKRRGVASMFVAVLSAKLAHTHTSLRYLSVSQQCRKRQPTGAVPGNVRLLPAGRPAPGSVLCLFTKLVALARAGCPRPFVISPFAAGAKQRPCSIPGKHFRRGRGRPPSACVPRSITPVEVRSSGIPRLTTHKT